MSALARIGDLGVGTCSCHKSSVNYTTTFATGAGTVLTNNQTSTVVGTVGSSSCGHDTTAIIGSPNVFLENKPAHRLADMGANCGPYTTTTASPNVFVNS